MTISTLEHIGVRCSSLAASPNLQYYLNRAEEEIQFDFGDRRPLVKALFAMHFYTIDGMTTTEDAVTAGKSVASMSEADLSLTFDNASQSSEKDKQYGDYAATVYGRELIRIFNGNIIGFRNTLVTEG
jgi:hypothetical protein